MGELVGIAETDVFAELQRMLRPPVHFQITRRREQMQRVVDELIEAADDEYGTGLVTSGIGFAVGSSSAVH